MKRKNATSLLMFKAHLEADARKRSAVALVPLFHSVRRYASDYLRYMHRKIGNIDMADAKLRHLENRPTLPDFYRRSASPV